MLDRMIHETARQLAEMFDTYHYTKATPIMRKEMEAKMDAIIDSIFTKDWHGKPVLRVELYKGNLSLNPVNEHGAMVLASMPMDELVEKWQEPFWARG